MSESKTRTIKLYCPSISKLIQFVEWEEQRLDLGAIARSFGLDPSTLRLNGHFISRGVDLVSPSVTWKSLLSFFSAKGLSTGKDNTDALVVDGKLSKVGAKRAHEAHCSIETQEKGGKGRPELEVTNLLKNKRMKEGNSGRGEDCGTSISNGPGFKRKQLLEDLSLFKKLRINETCTGIGNDLSKSIRGTKFRCSSSMSGHMKRIREDEAIVAAPYKRIR
ncbi:hypothetical protein UlMin_031865 [Ulmus minor]